MSSTTSKGWPRNSYDGPGGGLYDGPDRNPYHSNTPPREVYLEYLRTHPGYEAQYRLLKSAWRL